MKRIILVVLLCSLTLFAQNPKTYSLLGDLIYKNAQNLEKLKNKNLYNLEQENIEAYILKVNKLKKYGFMVDENKKNATKKEYLKKLRMIKKLNDKHVAKVHKNLFYAIDHNESVFFSQLINSGLVDIDKYKEDIRSYYKKHKDDVILPEDLENEFNYDENKVRKKRSVQSKLSKDEARVKRIRASEKAKQKRIEKELENQTKRKKEEIQEYQKKELSY